MTYHGLIQNYRIFHFEMEDCWIEIMDFCQLLLRRWEGWLPPRLDVARFKVLRCLFNKSM